VAILLFCCVLKFFFIIVSEAKAGTGTEAEPEPKTSGGVVSEQEGKVRNFFTESRVELSFRSTTILLIPIACTVLMVCAFNEMSPILVFPINNNLRNLLLHAVNVTLIVTVHLIQLLFQKILIKLPIFNLKVGFK
jgi:hypothetical protein